MILAYNTVQTLQMQFHTWSLLEQYNIKDINCCSGKKNSQNPCERFPIEASSASFVRLRPTLSFPLLSLLIQQLLDQVSYARRSQRDKMKWRPLGACGQTRGPPSSCEAACLFECELVARVVPLLPICHHHHHGHRHWLLVDRHVDRLPRPVKLPAARPSVGIAGPAKYVRRTPANDAK